MNTIGWRDPHLQIEGLVAAEFQKLFMDSWTKQMGALFAKDLAESDAIDLDR